MAFDGIVGSRLRRAGAALLLLLSGVCAAPADEAEDRRIAERLAAMLKAGRAVIFDAQPLINDASARDKDLGGDAVLARTVAVFREQTGVDPRAIDAATREGRLLGIEMDAIRAVMDANRKSLEVSGKEFKGFIPAVFGRLVSEEFSRRTEGLASMKFTAPLPLVRNRKSRPDAWEAATIAEHFLLDDWPKGRSRAQLVEENDRSVFRMAFPEYYAASCLSCHGGPKGTLDMTGYPREGASLGDLGGVVSIKLVRN